MALFALCRAPTNSAVNPKLVRGWRRRFRSKRLPVPSWCSMATCGHGAFPRENPGLRLSLSLFFGAFHYRLQENFQGRISDEMIARNGVRFRKLLNLEDIWGYSDTRGVFPWRERATDKTWSQIFEEPVTIHGQAVSHRERPHHQGPFVPELCPCRRGLKMNESPCSKKHDHHLRIEQTGRVSCRVVW